MNTKRKCQVVMLPTKSKSNIKLQMNGKLHLENGSSICLNSYQHLYITSNEEIKEGDWIQRGNEIPVLYTKDFWFDFGVSYNKVIATTDTSLKINKFNSGVFKELEYSLPHLSQQFVEAYVKAYNEGNPITEVDVEYVKTPNSVFISEIDAPYIQPKVNSDNTININPIKDSWSREEIKFIATRFAHECRLQGVITNNDTCNLFDKWIEENL